jgi:hypothetical protein
MTNAFVLAGPKHMLLSGTGGRNVNELNQLILAAKKPFYHNVSQNQKMSLTEK